MPLPLALAPVAPFIATQLGRMGFTSAARWAFQRGSGKIVSTVAQRAAPSVAKKVVGAGAGAAAVGGGAATVAGAGLLGSLFTAGIILAGVAAVGVVGYGVYKIVSGGGSSAQEVAAENPELAQALAPALAPQMTMAPMMPQPMMGQPQTPIMQGGMIPHAAYATTAYPAAVVDMPQMMQSAPANAWQERVGGRPVSQGSYVQSLTDPAAIAAMNNQQIQ